jgi:hypothetical protein
MGVRYLPILVHLGPYNLRCTLAFMLALEPALPGTSSIFLQHRARHTNPKLLPKAQNRVRSM